MAVPFNLSLSDLLLVEGFEKAWTSDDKKEFLKLLFENGMDISNGVEETVCTHRNLQGKIVTCARWQATERRDWYWLKYGPASLEAIIDSSSDPTLREELKARSQEGFSEEAYNAIVTTAIQKNKL